MKHEAKFWPRITKPDCPAPAHNGFPPSDVVTDTATKFAAQAPQAFFFIAKVSWPNAVPQKILSWQEENRVDAKEMAGYFLKYFNHVWAKWLPADLAARVAQGL